MSTATMAADQPWYRSLNATQWKTVFASNLGWTFDGYETFSLILVVGVALHDLLPPTQFGQIPAMPARSSALRCSAGASAASSAAFSPIISGAGAP